MDKAPKGIRLHIGLFGRMNVGKSSLLNMILNQDASITSINPGTTTDVVEKTMELLPIGPVVFHDTAGIDDRSLLSDKRIEKTKTVFDRVDIFMVIVEPQHWGEYEKEICDVALKKNIPLMIVVNKIDRETPSEEFLCEIRKLTSAIVLLSAIEEAKREIYMDDFRNCLKTLSQDLRRNDPGLLGDLIPAGGIGIMIVPIDLQAPKGRLILPQVQAIREALDNDASVIVLKEREYAYFLNCLNVKPDMVICDSQVVLKMVADTPKDIKCTTFSILFARYKGDLNELAKGAAAINALAPGDNVLIAEACSHHALEDDIGRVKIPRWLKQYTGCDLKIDICSGRDYPQDVKKYRLIVLCGSCMLNRTETINRIKRAKDHGVPVTNYGLCIAMTQGVLKRVLGPFDGALNAYEEACAVRRLSCR